MMTSVEHSLNLAVQRLRLQIAAELLVFDTAALKTGHFVLQKALHISMMPSLKFPHVIGRPIILALERALPT